MDDKRLKDLWETGREEDYNSEYQIRDIQRFISKKSNSVIEKIRKLLHFDIGLKLIIAFFLLVNVFIFFRIQVLVAYICLLLLPLLIVLILFNFGMLRQFQNIADYGQNTRDKLSQLMIFLKGRFFLALLSIASTYLFGFTAGVLQYFYWTYGYVRSLDNMDIFVFSFICLLGIIMNYATYSSMVRYQVKHLELCLSEFNEGTLLIVSQNIEERQKQDRLIKILLTIAIAFGLIVFIAVLKGLGI